MQSHFRFPLFATLFALALCAGAQQPLTFDAAQRLAVERSRTLAGQELAIGAARDMAVAAAQLPDPVLQLGIENIPVEGADKWSVTRDSMTMRRVGLMQELTRGEKRELRSQRFELEALRNTAERDMTIATIQRDTAIAWLEAWYAERIAAVVAEQRLRGLQEAQAAEAVYAAGRGSQADVFMAKGATAMIDDRAAEAERKVATAKTMLERWTGTAGPLAAPPDMSEVAVGRHVVEEHLSSHPEIVTLAREREIADSEARLARIAGKPDVSVELAYQVRGSAFGDMVSIGVSMPLPWDQPKRQDRELSAKLAAVAQAEARRDEALRMHVAEVRVLLQEWESGRERLVRYEREIVPLAASRAEAALAGYRAGKSGLADALASRRMELEARVQALQLEAETARLWARLAFLVPKEAK